MTISQNLGDFGSTCNDSGLLICSPRFDSWLLQLQNNRLCWIIFCSSKIPQILEFLAWPPCFQETIGNTEFFQMKVETLKRVYIFFSLLVRDGTSIKVGLENQLFHYWNRGHCKCLHHTNKLSRVILEPFWSLRRL